MHNRALHDTLAAFVEEAAGRLAEEGVSAQVLDLRTIVPLDVEGLVTAVERTGRCVVVHEAPLSAGFGAEVIADGNIHVYGTLRGRAVAGAGDDQDARIFALTFDPELVAIAGFYAVRENLGEVPKGRAVQVRLQGEQMRFEALG